MIGILFAFVRIATAFASDQIPDTDMHALAKEVAGLERFLFSEADFGAKANEAAIRDSFPVLGRHLEHLKAKVFNDQPALQANAEMLFEQVASAGRAFHDGDKSYARKVMISSLQLCASCHTRTAASDFVMPEANLKGASVLDRAAYFFATRQFDRGREEYELFLAGGKKGQAAPLVRSASLALATYYARVKLDPAGGKVYFGKLATDAHFSAAQQKIFRAWSVRFGSWAREAKEQELAGKEDAALKRARSELMTAERGEAGDVSRLRASVELHSILEGSGGPSPVKAEALLALGEIYEALKFPLYYRFGDMYLKSCVREYAKTKPAQLCFRALSTSVRKRIHDGDSDRGALFDEAELIQWERLAF